MKKEILIYVTKAIHPTLRYILSTNKTKGEYWFNELPPQKHGNEIEYHQSFDGLLSQLLSDCKLSFGEDDLRVFYNTEYKTIGKCITENFKAFGTNHRTEKVFNFVPMTEKEIFHFMNLFNKYNSHPTVVDH